jgi:hypothetical protein
MSRLRLVSLVLAVSVGAAVAVIVWSEGGERPEPAATSLPRDDAQRTLRTYLTEPGPGQIAPDGTVPGRIQCRRMRTGWRCVARYPHRIRVTCFVPDRIRGALRVNPICQ